MHRYAAMQRHWASHGPPTYIAVALYLGLTKPQPRPADVINDPEDLATFLRALPGASGA